MGDRAEPQAMPWPAGCDRHNKRCIHISAPPCPRDRGPWSPLSFPLCPCAPALVRSVHWYALRPTHLAVRPHAEPHNLPEVRHSDQPLGRQGLQGR